MPLGKQLKMKTFSRNSSPHDKAQGDSLIPSCTGGQCHYSKTNKNSSELETIEMVLFQNQPGKHVSALKGIFLQQQGWLAPAME